MAKRIEGFVIRGKAHSVEPAVAAPRGHLLDSIKNLIGFLSKKILDKLNQDNL